MNIPGDDAAVIALALALVGLVAALLFAYRLVRFAHRDRVGVEKVQGHLKLRRRMAGLAGREKDQYETVVRAETMYGWVWIVATRRRRQTFNEAMGWALTRRSARRALRRRP